MAKKVPIKHRSPRGSGGCYQKTGYFTDARSGELREYIYYQAVRDVAPEHLPRGVERKRITGNGKTEREARARLEVNWLAYHTGEDKQHRRGSPILTLEELYEIWHRELLAGKVSDIMTRKYEQFFNLHILPSLGKKKLNKITERDLRQFFLGVLPAKTRPNGEHLLKLAAIRNIYMGLSGCLKFGVENGYLQRSPLKAVKLNPPPQPLYNVEAASDNARILFDNLIKDKGPDYCRWLFQFLGLRRAERLGLTWDRIERLNSKEPTLVIQKQLARYANGDGWYLKDETKTKRIRRVVVPEPFLSALREHKKIQDKMKQSPDWKPEERFADCVFLQPNGAIYTLNRDNEEWAKLLKKYALPHWRGHMNRHITATWLAEEYPPIPMGTVQSILGHDSEAMAHYYAKSTRDQQAEPMRRYGETLLRNRGKKKRS